MSSLPSTCADINDVPRTPSSWKLRYALVDEDGETRLIPWRTEENHMSEWIEVMHRFTKPGDVIWDPTCGAMTSALAAFRLNRMIIVSDKDEELVKAATFRLMYYHHWAMKTYAGLMLYTDPPKNDGANHYRFNLAILNKKYLACIHRTLPKSTIIPGLGKVGSARHNEYLASKDVIIQPSKIKGAGMGLFLIAPKVVGDKQVKNSLQLPYWGKFSPKIVGDRAISLELGGEGEIFILGAANCPAAFMNDPWVSLHVIAFL